MQLFIMKFSPAFCYLFMLKFNTSQKNFFSNAFNSFSYFNVRYQFTLLHNNVKILVEEEEANLMSLVIKFYFTSSMLNMFRT